MATEVNRTNTNFEAWCDKGAAHLVNATKKVNDTLCVEAIKKYVTGYLDKLIWASPFLIARVAPMTFTVAVIVGGVAGIFSNDSMNKIFTNVDNILNGGVREGSTERNTNFKVSLIFASIIASSFLPIPSLGVFYAAAAGMILGARVSLWVPDDHAKIIGQKIDQWIPLPPCPGFKKVNV